MDKFNMSPASKAAAIGKLLLDHPSSQFSSTALTVSLGCLLCLNSHEDGALGHFDDEVVATSEEMILYTTGL
jgi:hypothetical protein